MNKNPLVSVIIPCYNVSAYVKKAIVSITQQTHINLEILVIDDASTDDTLSQIKSIEDKRIKVFEYKKNTLKIGAVNEVLQKVNGDLICFQDADDWSEPERIEKQVIQFKIQTNLGICFTSYRKIGNKVNVPARIALSNNELRKEFLGFGRQMNSDFSPTVCATMMFTKEVLHKSGGYHPYFAGRVAEDIHWLYRIIQNTRAITINEVLYNYRVHDKSLTANQHSGANVKAIYAWELLSNIIEVEEKEGIDILNVSYSKRLSDIELLSCEQKLSKVVYQMNSLRLAYEKSTSYKLGKYLISPFLFIKKLFNRR